MGYLGSWKIDDQLTFAANTFTPSTGAETDADAAPTYRVYEDETATPILTGSMALLDDANTVGFYSEQITLSAANGFEKGKAYTIRVRGVVGGVAGAEVHTFQIEAEVDANTISPTGTGLTAIPWNAAWDAEVQSEVQDALEVNDLDHLIQITAGAEEPTDGSYLDQVMHKDASQTYSPVTDSLEALGGKIIAGATNVSSVGEGNDYTVSIGDNFDENIEGTGDMTGWAKAWFTVKEDLEADADVVVLLWSREDRDRQLTFAKIRDGQGSGTVELDWDPVYVQFNQVDAAVPEPDEPGADDVPF